MSATVNKVSGFHVPVGCPKPEGRDLNEEDVRKWVQDKNPNTFQKASYGTYSGLGVLVLGAVLGLFGINSESGTSKALGGAITVGGLITALVGLFGGVKPGENKKPDGTKNPDDDKKPDGRKPKTVEEILSEYANDLKNPDSAIMVRVGDIVEEYKRTNDERIFKAIIDTITNTNVVSHARTQAAFKLWHEGIFSINKEKHSGVIDTLIECSKAACSKEKEKKDDEEEVKESILQALCHIYTKTKEQKAINAAVSIFVDDENNGRDLRAHALDSIMYAYKETKEKEILEPVLNYLIKDCDDIVFFDVAMRIMCESYEHSKDIHLLDKLLEMASKNDYSFKSKRAEVMKNLGYSYLKVAGSSSKIIHLLNGLLDDSDTAVQEQAKKGLKLAMGEFLQIQDRIFYNK